MRFTIERIRTMVLAAGVLLVAALAVFLAVGRSRNLLGGRDLPKRLGENIVQEASGVTYMEAHGGHMLFRIHASRAEQLKNEHALLHDVQIEFFSKDGRSADSISGSDFEYDQKSGVGTAQGPVQITVSRLPDVTAKGAGRRAEVPATGTVQVEASGLTFNQNTGVLTTAKEVSFRMANGSGLAVGARYDSQQGYLVLDHAVQLTTERGGQKVVVHADHAEFERDAQFCRLTNAVTEFKTGQASAGQAKILFRGDGTAEKLDAADGFTLATTGGGRVTAPLGTLGFGENNEPESGELQGGVKLNSVSPGRQLQGSAPVAQLEFSPAGELRLLKLNDGAEMRSDTQSGAGAQRLRMSRTWRSPVAEVNFRRATNGGIEPAKLYGVGGVVVTSKMQRGSAAPAPARLAADQVTGDFGPGAELTAIEGTGHATMEQTLADGAQQSASGDRINARFAPAAETVNKTNSGRSATADIQSAVLVGHVVMVQAPAPKAGAQAHAPLRAVAGRAVYEDAGQRLRLTGNPRVEDGGVNLTAETIDLLQQAGEVFAHGDVKATWLEAGAAGRRNGAAAGLGGVALGGQTPAHVIADEAEFSRAGDEAVFRGHARLWQDANSIAAPVIALSRDKQTLVAQSHTAGEPVKAVLLGTGEAAAEMAPAQGSQRRNEARTGTPAVIRVRGGEFTYSDAQHRAVMTGGVLGEVVAEAGGATCRSKEVVLLLRSRGASQTAEVEQVTASGEVVVSSQGRRGEGAKLVYSSLTGEYALTGTPATPPKLTDPTRGTVTGAALIFNSLNDSVSIEGRGRETRTETTAPK